MKVHDQIKFVRKLRGWTQEEIANKLEMSVNGYGDIERGETDIPFSRLEQITQILGVQLIELLGLNEKNVMNLVSEMNSSNWNPDNNSNEFSDYQRLVAGNLKEIIELLKVKNDSTT
jgi:transcriptional regulator with XRE-family HTH domain